jgi:hypothetical protein
MAQSVIVKKEEKVSAVVSSLPSGFSSNEFVDAFIEMYPKEWERVQKIYGDHERRTKLGKMHPMPEPRQYLINALNVLLEKQMRN